MPDDHATPRPIASGRQLVSRSSRNRVDAPIAGERHQHERLGDRVERGRPARVRSGRPTARRPAPGSPSTNGGIARRSGRPGASDRLADLVAVGRPAPRDEHQQRRHEGIADELDDGGHVQRGRPVGRTGGDDLARVVDRDPGPQPERRLRTGRRRCPIEGYSRTASVPNSVIVATAYATSRGLAAITGAVATIAVLPQTADPTASSTASRFSTLTMRASSRTRASDAAIVTTIVPSAGSADPGDLAKAQTSSQQHDPRSQERTRPRTGCRARTGRVVPDRRPRRRPPR